MDKLFKVNIDEVKSVLKLNPDQGWIGMKVQFLVDAVSGGSELLVFGRARFAPDKSQHQCHRHVNAEEFSCIISGEGVILHGDNEIPVKAGDVTFHKRSELRGFRNTSDYKEVEMLWGWAGAASKEEAGYELRYPDRVTDLHAH
jgi:uncharacterized cupin superfamily protein